MNATELKIEKDNIIYSMRYTDQELVFSVEMKGYYNIQDNAPPLVEVLHKALGKFSEVAVDIVQERLGASQSERDNNEALDQE